MCMGSPKGLFYKYAMGSLVQFHQKTFQVECPFLICLQLEFLLLIIVGAINEKGFGVVSIPPTVGATPLGDQVQGSYWKFLQAQLDSNYVFSLSFQDWAILVIGRHACSFPKMLLGFGDIICPNSTKIILKVKSISLFPFGCWFHQLP